MFKEIKRKITLFNSLTLVVFLCLFMFFIGSMINFTLSFSGESYLENVSVSLINRFLGNEGDLEDFSLKKKNNNVGGRMFDDLGFEYLILDSQYNVVKKDMDSTELLLRIREMEMNSHHHHPRFRTFILGGDVYRICTSVFEYDGEEYFLQCTQVINSERAIFSYLVGLLISISIIGVLLLIPISSYLAGKSLKPVKDAFEMQKNFIADASHELRTPLTVIQTNVEVLRMKEDEVLADNIHWLDNIQIESETMASLIRELLMIAQADNKKIVMEKKVFDLSALCAEVVDLMFDVAKNQQILLKGIIPKGIEYKGDAEKLKQAIRILVDNAIKYTPGEGEVTLTLLESSRSVIIAVRDTGVGLSEEDQKKIFARFYRVDDARHRESGGVGLGLNIAKMVAEQHGGKIEIESVPDQGSTFSIVLPRTNKKVKE